MDLNFVREILRRAPRSGSEIDVPEGARVVVLSETLVKKMLAAFESEEAAADRRTGSAAR